jgi:hypothetical protein
VRGRRAGAAAPPGAAPVSAVRSDA